MSQGFKVNKKGNIIYFTAQALQQEGIIHAFSSRHGGVSTGPYTSLNLGYHTGDNPEDVTENRLRWYHTLGIDPTEPVTGEQVHGDRVRIVTSVQAGAGALDMQGWIPGTDALITKDKVALMAFFADCVPILIYDNKQKAAGVAHAGWRGTVAKIAWKTVSSMVREFSTNPRNCFIAIGPSVGPCCYEVGNQVVEQVRTAFPYWQDLAEERGANRWTLDLWEANRQSLIEAGVPAENITVSGMCTCCNQDMFFSYRGQSGVTGRLAALIRLI